MSHKVPGPLPLRPWWMRIEGALGERGLLRIWLSSLQAPWVVEGSRPPKGWPTHGEVKFQNYSVRYRPGLELVLKNLTLHVHGGEKVHVPGNTAFALMGSAGAPA